jgi:hypothetical protein
MSDMERALEAEIGRLRCALGTLVAYLPSIAPAIDAADPAVSKMELLSSMLAVGTTLARAAMTWPTIVLPDRSDER